MADHGLHLGDIVCVFAESVVMRNGFWLRIDQEFIRIAAASLAVEGSAPLPEDFLELLLFMGGELLDGLDAQSSKGALGDFADAGNFADREGSEETRFHSRHNENEATRLRLIRSDLRNQTSGGEPAGAGKGGRLRDHAQQLVCGSKRRAVQAFCAAEVKIGFIDRGPFDDRGEFGEDGSNAVAPFGVSFVMAIEKNRVWAKASRGTKRHGGLDSVLARFITGGGDDAALIRPAAYHNRLAAQFGALEQFHGDEEGVHVDVENRGIKRNLARFRRIMLG